MVFPISQLPFYGVDNGHVFYPYFIFIQVFHFQSSLSFSVGGRFYSGNNQFALSGSLQETCHSALQLNKKFSVKKEAKASTLSMLIFVSLFVLCCCCCCCEFEFAHLCVAECGAKRRLGCVDINGFTMECVKAWELVAAQLHSTVGTVGALLYQQEAVHCSKHKHKHKQCTAARSALQQEVQQAVQHSLSALQQALSPNCIALHCKLLYHDNGAKHQRKELPTPASTSTLLLSTQYLQV